MQKKSFIRAQPIICGKDLKTAEYFDLDLFPVTERQHRAKPRAKRKLATTIAQAARNAKNAIRYFVRLVNTNFLGRPDAKLATLNFDDEHLPATGEEADALMMKWWRRVKDRCKWKGLPEPFMVAVTEWQEEDPAAGKKRVRPHCHVILCCALTREELELLWNTGGPHCGARASLHELRKYAVMLGSRSNVDELRPDRGSLEDLARYLTKNTKRKHRWHRSRGLAEPIMPRPNDTKYTRAKLLRLIQERLDDRDYWREQYPGWELREAVPEFNDMTGWTLRLQFYKPGLVPLIPPKVNRDRVEEWDAVLCALCGVEPPDLPAGLHIGTHREDEGRPPRRRTAKRPKKGRYVFWV